MQRTWLAGFLAGLEAAAGGAPQIAAPPVAAEPLTIVYATESGNSEKIIRDHYLNTSTSNEAKNFWRIYPEDKSRS